MTVEELIKKLENYPVTMQVWNKGFCDYVDDVYESTVEENGYDKRVVYID